VNTTWRNIDIEDEFAGFRWMLAVSSQAMMKM